MITISYELSPEKNPGSIYNNYIIIQMLNNDIRFDQFFRLFIHQRDICHPEPPLECRETDGIRYIQEVYIRMESNIPDRLDIGDAAFYSMTNSIPTPTSFTGSRLAIAIFAPRDTQ